MSERQLPKWSELKPLLRPKPLELNPTERRLASAVTGRLASALPGRLASGFAASSAVGGGG